MCKGGTYLRSVCCKEPSCNARDVSSVSGKGRSPGGEHGKPLQYPCPENPMDFGAWRAAVYRVRESDMTKEAEHGMALYTLQGTSRLEK